MRIVVTGGAGYIGSHVCLALMNAEHDVYIVDDLSNSSVGVIAKLEQLSGKRVHLIHLNLLNGNALLKSLKAIAPDATIHLAAFKAVGESVIYPLKYYRNNVVGLLNLLEAMEATCCHNLVFSSSCTVYGEPEYLPINELHPIGRAVNPYGRTKVCAEQILGDLHVSNPTFNCAILRYFNPVGAHESGELGESPNGIPQNLMPLILRVAIGKIPSLKVFGHDYPTRDGTCIRDYIHVVDLAEAHVLAVEQLESRRGVNSYNIGTGTGTTICELISAFEKSTGIAIKYEFRERRPGDAVAAFADATKARLQLGWQAKRDLSLMCKDSWNWQCKYPNGIAEFG